MHLPFASITKESANLPIFNQMLTYGDQTGATDTTAALLSAIASNSTVDAIRSLCQEGANPRMSNQFGQDAVYMAIINNSLPILRFLVQEENVSLDQTYHVPSVGHSLDVLALAYLHSGMDIVSYLIDYCKHPSFEGNMTVPMLSILIISARCELFDWLIFDKQVVISRNIVDEFVAFMFAGSISFQFDDNHIVYLIHVAATCGYPLLLQSLSMNPTNAFSLLSKQHRLDLLPFLIDFNCAVLTAEEMQSLLNLQVPLEDLDYLCVLGSLLRHPYYSPAARQFLHFRVQDLDHLIWSLNAGQYSAALQIAENSFLRLLRMAQEHKAKARGHIEA